MSIASIKSFPHSGPFTIDGSYAPKQYIVAFLLGISMLVLGVGLMWVVSGVFQDVRRVARIWSSGEAAIGEVVYKGSVRQSKYGFRHYDMTVYFFSSPQQRNNFHAKFTRFIYGPSEGDAMKVRYLLENPNIAVSSWQYESRFQRWGGIIFGGLLSLGLLRYSFLGPRNRLQKLRKLKNLARSGQLVPAKVISNKAVRINKSVHVTINVGLPNINTFEHTFVLGRNDPWFIAGNSMIIVIYSLGGVHVLRKNGYPLKL